MIAGSSAGALGVAAWSDYLLKTFKYQRAAVILDSYMGVFPQDTAGKLVKRYDVCNLPPIATNAYLKENCDSEILEVYKFVVNAIASHPDVAFSVLNTKIDAVQQVFYKLVGDAFGSWDTLLLPSQYYHYTNRHLEVYNAYPNFVCYIVDGVNHVMNSLVYDTERFFTTSTAGAGWPGTPPPPPSGATLLHKWVGQVINHERVSSQCNGPRRSPSGMIGSLLTNYCSNKVFEKQLTLPR